MNKVINERESLDVIWVYVFALSQYKKQEQFQQRCFSKKYMNNLKIMNQFIILRLTMRLCIFNNTMHVSNLQISPCFKYIYKADILPDLHWCNFVPVCVCLH